MCCTQLTENTGRKNLPYAHHRITKIHFRGLLPPNRILPGAKFTLRPILVFSHIGSVTARHSSSGRQPNFASWYKEWNYGTFPPRHRPHLHSAGRPSHGTSVPHLLCTFFCSYVDQTPFLNNCSYSKL